MARNPPPMPQGTVPPRTNPSTVQQGAVDVAASLLPPAPQMQTTGQQQVVVLAQQQHAQGNPVGAVAASVGPPPLPPVMTLAQLQQYVMQQGHRVQFTRHE